MSIAAIAKKVRAQSAGAPPPEARPHVLKLISGLMRLKRYYPTHKENRDKVTTYDRALFHFLYLWLTGGLEDCQSIADFPDIEVVTCSQPCGPHRLRSTQVNCKISWVEYALPYPTKTGTEWLWQPLPQGLNEWFSLALTQTQRAANIWVLSHQEKHTFLRFLHTKWRTPALLNGEHLVRRDRLFGYFDNMVKCDSTLPVTAKAVILGEMRLHHPCALRYQISTSDEIRHGLFHHYNDYLDRLLKAIPTDIYLERLDVLTPCSNRKIGLLHSSHDLPPHLQTPGSIEAFHLEMGSATRTHHPLPFIHIGSIRPIANHQVKRLFQALEREGHALERAEHSLESLKALHNFYAFELSLLLIALTGTRPTHHISIERQWCFNLTEAIVRDKGKHRPIWLCDGLRVRIKRYQHVQHNLRTRGVACSSPHLWCLLDEKYQTHTITAKSLRQFMATRWQALYPGEAVVPYQLRHHFAQHALANNKARLALQDIDYLMGHSELGEGLGSDMIYPTAKHTLKRFLNEGIAHIGLKTEVA
ncbi:site-specific integrase [Vibrio astriarenae]